MNHYFIGRKKVLSRDLKQRSHKLGDEILDIRNDDELVVQNTSQFLIGPDATKGFYKTSKQNFNQDMENLVSSEYKPPTSKLTNFAKRSTSVGRKAFMKSKINTRLSLQKFPKTPPPVTVTKNDRFITKRPVMSGSHK